MLALISAKTLVANSFYSFQSRRLSGCSRHWSQSREVRAARRGSRCPGQPGLDSSQIDRRSSDEVLQVCLGVADIATAPQTTAAHSLLMGAFDTRSCGILVIKRLRRLLLSRGLQSLVLRPRQ